MVGAFAGLKWRLVTSLFRATDGPARTAVIAGFVVAIMLIGLLTVGIAALRLAPASAEPVVVALFCLQLVGWMLTPLLAFGIAVLGSTAAACYLSVRGAAKPDVAVRLQRSRAQRSRLRGEPGRLRRRRGRRAARRTVRVAVHPGPGLGLGRAGGRPGSGDRCVVVRRGGHRRRYLDRAPDIYATVAAGDRA